MRWLAACLGLALALPAAAQTQPPIRIGFISTFTGASALSGVEMLNGFKLGIAHLGGKLGGRDVDLIIGDDQTKTEIGLQLAQKMIESDHVELLTGMVLSNVMLAVTHAFEPAEIPFISLNAGPSLLAGKQCNKYFFADSYQVDSAAEAMGTYLSGQKVGNVYLLASNYQAGRDMLAGFKRRFTGAIAGEEMTPLGTMDYAAEIAKLRSVKPDAAFFFYTSIAGINFLKQYQAGGLKGTLPLYATTFSVDQSMLPSLGDAADGVLSTSMWGETLDNPENRAFVAEHIAAIGRLPSLFAATGYDGAMLIDSALRKTGGRTADKDALIKALEAADFRSVRGSFRFNTNHFPIQDYYLLQVSRNEKGEAVNKVVGTVAKDVQDSYVGECRM